MGQLGIDVYIIRIFEYIRISYANIRIPIPAFVDIPRIYTCMISESNCAVQTRSLTYDIYTNIYIFIAIALDESIFLDVLHSPMKNIKSHDLEATPMGGATS